MDDKSILKVFQAISASKDFNSSPIDKTLLTIKMHGGEVNSLLQKSKRRRSKKDKKGRNFHCGCGKQYLSYPALYTHIKNKHGGIDPPGTTKQDSKRFKGGRGPKGSRFSRLGETKTPPHGSATVDSKDNLSIKSGMTGGTDLSPLKLKPDGFKKSFKIDIDDLPLIDELNCEGKCSPTHSFQKKRNIVTNQFILHPFAEIINKLKHFQVEDQFYERDLTCDKIISLFLYELSKVCNEKLYSMVALLMRALRSCLNEFGYDLLELYEKQNSEAKLELLRENNEGIESEKAVFCHVEPAWYISLLFDFFVKEFLPAYMKDDQVNVSFVSKLLFGFNRWLVENKLTRIECSFSGLDLTFR